MKASRTAERPEPVLPATPAGWLPPPPGHAGVDLVVGFLHAGHPPPLFHKGTRGQWLEVLDPEAERRYWTRVRELADPELVAWLHRSPATDAGVPA